MEAFWVMAWPLLMALLAVGAVLSIKIARRRHATRTGRFDGTVPANPLSAQDARRMGRRYYVGAAALIVVLILFAILASSAR